MRQVKNTIGDIEAEANHAEGIAITTSHILNYS